MKHFKLKSLSNELVIYPSEYKQEIEKLNNDIRQKDTFNIS